MSLPAVTAKLNEGLEKLQLLVDMVQECTWITVDPPWFIGCSSDPFILYCAAEQRFIFILFVWILIPPPHPQSPRSYLPYFWKWETFTGPPQLLGIPLDICQATLSQMFEKQIKGK